MKKIEQDRKPFDFDYWCKLAKDDPQRFEAERREAIEEVIAKAPSAETQERLTKLQWRVDMERRRSKNPTHSCVQIYNMMWKRVYGKDGLLESLNALVDGNTAAHQEQRKSAAEQTADVLTFRVGNSSS